MFAAAFFCWPLVAWCEPRLGAAVVHSNLNVVTEVGDVPTVTHTHVAPRAQMGDKHDEKYSWAYKCVQDRLKFCVGRGAGDSRA